MSGQDAASRAAERSGGRRRAAFRPRLSTQDIPRAARIFANRNLKMSSVKMIGFDMDHTLAVYRPQETEELAFRESQKKLVTAKGYPEQILTLTYDREFVIRGLVVDKPRGNIIKMDRHHYVARAYHGLSALPRADRKSLYKGRKIPLSQPSYASVDSLFSLPEVSLYAQLVTWLEGEGGAGRRDIDYEQLYDDVRECMDEAHRDGSIKSIIEQSPEAYVAVDENLAHTFDKFRRHGKRLFLLTNSEQSYTDTVMRVLLDGRLKRYPHWTSYFDVIVVSAAKPGFFVGGAPLVHAEGPRAGEPVRSRDPGKFFRGGNADEFESRCGFRGDQILYFGDHTYGDILRSKSTSGWRTAMIISELEHEIHGEECASRDAARARDAERALDRLISDRDLFEIELAARTKQLNDPELPEATRVRVLDEVRRMKRGLRDLDRRIIRAEKKVEASWEASEAIYNRYWGPVFKNGTTQSRFAAQVTRFACIYTSRASNFFYYPVNKYFKPHREMMAHELER